MLLRRVLWGMVCVAGFVIGAPSQAAAQSTGKYDDAARIYLLRNLEHTFATWRHPTQTTPAELRDWLFATRDRLIRLKKGAESYGSEPVIVSAYDDTLKLLEIYEQYLRDVIMVDFSAGISRSNDADFVSRVGVGASAGAGAGFLAGTVFCPVIGNVVGAPVGAVLGAAEGTVRWVVEGQEAIEKNKNIDAQARAAKRELIGLLQLHLKSTVTSVKTQARILAGETKYGWGERVGFDGSDSLPLDEQLRRRPQDPFVHLMLGAQWASNDVQRAAESFARAAELVPRDADGGVDFFDLDRAEYYLTAARLAERAARRTWPADRQLALKSIEYHRLACERLADGGLTLPLPTKMVLARAHAIVGQMTDSYSAFEREIASLDQKAGERDATYVKAQVLYDYASAKALAGDTSSAFELLRRSFQTQPRWQPHSLRDSQLAALASSDALKVETICADPLVGTWTSPTLTMEFYLNGSLRQTSQGVVKLGGYQRLDNGQLRLFSNTKDLSFPFSVSRENLAIGSLYRMSRVKPKLAGRWRYGMETFEFREDGTWTKLKEGSATHGNYSVLSSAPGAAWSEFVYGKNEDVLIPVERRFQYQVTDSKLTIHVPRLNRDFEYTREF
jgi:tetratricopeptide (TPR) repeat protein